MSDEPKLPVFVREHPGEPWRVEWVRIAKVMAPPKWSVLYIDVLSGKEDSDVKPGAQDE